MAKTHYSLVVFDTAMVSVLPFKKALRGSSAPASSQLMPTGWLLRLVVGSVVGN